MVGCAMPIKTDNYRIPKPLSDKVKALAKTYDPRVSATALIVSFVAAGVAQSEKHK